MGMDETKDISKAADLKYLKIWLDIFYLSYRYFLSTMESPEHQKSRGKEAQEAIEVIGKILDNW